MQAVSRRLAFRSLLGGLVLLLTVALTAPAFATGPLYTTTYPSKITNKLGRGVGNILFCWVEIPLEINEEIQNTDPFTGTFVGLGKGVFYTGQRLVLGTVDVVTFPVDLYGNNFQSVQRTEFPFIDEVD